MYRKNIVILSIIATACIGHAQNRAASEAYVTNRVNIATSAVFRAAASLATQTVNDAIAAIPPVVETDTAALAALATNKPARLWGDTNTWIELHAGGVLRGYAVAYTTAWQVVLSDIYGYEEDLLQAATNFLSDAPFPLTYGTFIGFAVVNEPTAELVPVAPLDVLSGYGSSVGIDFGAASQVIVFPGDKSMSLTYGAHAQTNSTDFILATNSVGGLDFSALTNWIGGALTNSGLWTAVTTAQDTADEALFAADGASGTINNHLSAGNAHASLFAAKISQAQGDARYLSSTPGWFLQGSQVISTNTWTTNLTGYASVSNGMIALVPYTTSRHDVTGTVTVTSQRYIVGVSAAWSMALSSDPTMPRTPMGYRAFERVSPTSFTASAWCSTKPDDANPYYWGYVSNIVVQTYDRAEMSPGTYTNDAAGIVSRVDSLPTTGGVPVTGNGHARAAVNAESMRLYVDARKDEIARSAYNWTPAGRPSPSAQTFTVDEPLVQQGAISYLNSGDYYCMSYAGGDWISSTTGSVWRIGPSGRVSFEIASTNRMLHISGFSVAGGYATLDISTNWVVGTPSVEFTDNLANPQWLSCPAQVMSNGVSFWRGTCPAVSSNRFFRVVDPSGDNVIRSHTRHEFLAGVTIGTNTFHSLTELKAQLEALP